MANAQRGEVSFEAEGKPWTVRYSVNALCELEEELGLGISEIAGLLGDSKMMRLKTVRAVLWAGLRDHHPEVDIKRAGDLIADITLPAAIDLIGRGFVLAFPDSGAKGKNPRQPGGRNGTGPASTERGADSVVAPRSSGEERPAKSP